MDSTVGGDVGGKILSPWASIDIIDPDLVSRLLSVEVCLATILVLILESAFCYKRLKEYYEIVDEARPLSGLFPTHADFVTEMYL